MRYEMMGHNRARRLNVPQLLGGLNTAADPSLIADDELADVCNLTPKHGALVTRGAVRAIGDEPLIRCAGENILVDKVLHHPLMIGDELCTVVLTAASESTQEANMTVQVVSLDGVCKEKYTMEVIATDYTFAVAPCDIEQYGAAFLIYHHGNVYLPDKTSQTMKQASEDKLYAPLVMINAQSTAEKPSYKQANGVMYEGFNALTSRYRAQFTPSVAQAQNITAEYYAMPTKLLRNTVVTMEILLPVGASTVSMQVEGDAVGFQIGAAHYNAQAFGEGYVKVSPALPASELSGTVTVIAERTGERTKNGTQGATLATWFGGTQNAWGGTRLFLGGFGNAKLMWSDVNNPFYFPENNYLFVGDLSGHIKALEKQGDMLVIFKERELFYTTYVQGSVNTDAVANGTNVDVTAAQAYFPLTQLSPSIGCRCPNSIARCRDRLVWLDEDARVYTLVLSGAYSERNVREIGQKVRPFLLKHTTVARRKGSSAMDHDGKYRLLIGNMMVEFDYNDSGFVNVPSYASGQRAGRNIAWFVHRFDGFADNAAQCLISDGADRALLLDTYGVSSAESIVRMLYTFDAAGNDRYVYILYREGRFSHAVTEQTVTSTLTTKTYELGDPAMYKRMGALFLMMRTNGARVYSIPNGLEPSNGRFNQSDDLHAHLLLPAVKRCQSIAFRVDAAGELCVKGLRLQYTPFGTVR